MASQKLFRLAGVTETGVAVLYFECPVGASGAPGTASLARGFAATPISRSGAGTYVLALAEAWNDDMFVDVRIIDSAASTGNARSAIVTARSVTGSTPTITFKTYDETGTVADPRNGAFLSVRVEIQNGQRL